VSACCLKYGVTSDYVLALEVVTADAEVVLLGHETAKRVAGYDLASLMVSSEGTLGIITESTVRLRLRPHPSTTVVGFLPDVESAGLVVRDVTAAGLTPAVLELVDKHCLEAIDAWHNMGLGIQGADLLLACVDEAQPSADEVAEAIVRHFDDTREAPAQKPVA